MDYLKSIPAGLAVSVLVLCFCFMPGRALANWDPMPASGARNVLVVLVEFSDRPLSTTPTEWSDAFFDTTPGVKSVANYYSDNSFGAVSIVPVSHTQSGNPPGVVTVTLPTPNPSPGNGDTFLEETTLLSSIMAIAEQYVDFPSYDTNGDGTLQPTEINTCFVMAGYEAACTTKTPNFWAHANYGYGVTADGLNLIYWERQGELNNSDVRLPIGTLAHEMGHSVFGLPDLYDLNQANFGLGIFSLMSYGSWGMTSSDTYQGTTPVAMDAWCRQYLGWSTPRLIPSGQTASFGPPLASADAPVKMMNGSASTTEYFLVENRYPESWDLGLEHDLGAGWGGGLLIQHIDISAGSSPVGDPHWGGDDINNTALVSHQGVLAEEASTANGSIVGGSSNGDPTHLFYNGNNSAFSDTSSPNTRLYSGSSTGLSIFNISDKARTMTATVTNTMPTAEITEPLNSALLTGATYTVTGTATDLSGTGLQKVEVSTDGGATWSPASGTSSWSYDWRLPADGVYGVMARATDNKPETGPETPEVPVTVDNTNPLSEVTYPAGGATLPPPGVTVTGTAVDNESSGLKYVELSTDGGATWNMAVDTSGDSSWSSWSYDWTFSATTSCTVVSRATDNLDVVEVAGPGVTVYVDITPPDGSLVLNSGSGYSESLDVDVALAATDIGVGVSDMQLSDDGVFDTEPWEAFAGSKTWTFAGTGEHVLYCRFRDAVGNVSPVFSDTVTVVTSSQTPFNELWVRQDGTSSFDISNSVACDGSGNVYIAGYSQGDLAGTGNAGIQDLFVSKYGPGGSHLWTRQMGTSQNDSAEGVAVDASGNVYAAGSTYGGLDGNSSSGGADVFIVKYDTDGVKQWTRQTGSSLDDTCRSVALDPDGNIFVAGYTTGGLHGNTNAGLRDAFLMKYNPTGTRLWTRMAGTSSDEYCNGVAAGPDGSAVITGFTSGDLDGNTSQGGSDIFIIKYDSAGTKKWTKLHGTSSNDYAAAVTVDSAGGIIVAGKTQGGMDGHVDAGYGDVVLVKFGSDGSWLWTDQLGTPDYDKAGWVAAAGDSIYLAISAGDGLYGDTTLGSDDVYVMKYLSGGELMWYKRIGSSSTDLANGVTPDGSGNVIVTGYTWGAMDGQNRGNEDLFVAKLGIDFTLPELPHFEWDASLSGGDCSVCHVEPASFLQAGFMRDDPAFCRSCHNAASRAHDMNPFSKHGHSVMSSVTSAGVKIPAYGNITAGQYNNQPYSRLKGGDKVVCTTCHNVMRKTEDYSRVWELTTTQDNVTYTLEKGGWENYAYLDIKVYRDTGLWTGPFYVKDRKGYLVDPSEYTFDETLGEVAFKLPQDPLDYIYVTLDYPYLRANNSGNRLCSDCHTQATHMGGNCLVCHTAHGTDNISLIREEVRLPNHSTSAVVFTGYSGPGSFADGDAVYNGICEVCHSQTLYHRKDGGGSSHHDGEDCTVCHPHDTGFPR